MNFADKIKDWGKRTKQFYVDVRSETRKVTWPSRQEVMGTTVVVVFAVAFFGLYLGLVDYLLGVSLDRVLTYFSRTGG